MFNNKNFSDENLKVFKKNITRVLTLLSRDKYFLALLNEMSCFEVFLDLYKNDLTLYISKIIKNEETVGSAKSVRDGVADFLGIKDNDDAVAKWEYGEQIKSAAYGVRVEIQQL